MSESYEEKYEKMVESGTHINGHALRGRRPKSGRRCRCANCGSTIIQDSNYCNKCGIQLPYNIYKLSTGQESS